MALGQYIAGMGFSNVGLGLVHGMAHPLGAFYNTPHGVANAILLPHVMRYNADFSGEKFRDIARAMGEKVDGVSLEQARQSAVDAVFRLNRDVGIPPHLRDVGVRKEDIPALAQAAFADVCTGGIHGRPAWRRLLPSITPRGSASGGHCTGRCRHRPVSLFMPGGQPQLL